MTLNEILQAVDDELGESTGYWQREEKVRWAQLALTRHAREGLSVPAEVRTSSLPGVQEYHLPDDFGELMNVRYAEDDLFGLQPLTYVDKQSILSAHGTTDTKGTPYACYTYQDKLGLYPVPDKAPVLSCKFEGTICERFAELPFTCEFEVSVEHAENADPDDVLNPCRVYVSHISLHLRRKGYSYPGDLTLSMTPLAPEGYAQLSHPIPANSVAVRPEWYHFDFSLSPIELTETRRRWRMRLYGDSEYLDADPEVQRGDGVQIGVDASEARHHDDSDRVTSEDDVAWFEMHRLKNDIQVDYYRNTCPAVTDFDEALNLPLYPPVRYHPTIVTMTVEKALRKGQYNIPVAESYKARADEDIAYARSQAKLKTYGDILRVPRAVRLAQADGPYVNVVGDRFVGRAW